MTGIIGKAIGWMKARGKRADETSRPLSAGNPVALGGNRSGTGDEHAGSTHMQIRTMNFASCRRMKMAKERQISNKDMVEEMLDRMMTE